MNLLRMLFAAVWLLFGMTTAAQASPMAETPCHGESHHAPAPEKSNPLQAAMTCCAQPALPDAPAPVLTTRRTQPFMLAPAVSTLPAGIVPASDPRPPKNV